MSHAKALYHWEQRVATFFTDLPPTRQAWLALGASFNTLRKRYRPQADAAGRDRSFDGTACFGPLLRWATAGFRDRRVALAIDSTNLGSRFTIRTVSVVFRGCAVPVAWQVQGCDQKGRRRCGCWSRGKRRSGWRSQRRARTSGRRGRR